MYGAMEFYYAARDTSLTPIIGCEAYIAPRGRFDRTVRDEAHVTLLAADLVGYRNLTALISKGFLEGYYYKPRIDLDLLAKHNDGLIVLSGCMSGMVASPLLKGDYDTSVKNAKTFIDIFGDRFYIEVMRHGMPEEDVINDGLVKVARQLNVPLVATNDSHYLEQRDAPAHDVLLCIGTGKTVSDTSRMKFYSDQFYVKSPAEMYELWSDLPEACANTVEIAKRIDIKIPEKIFHLPQYPVPQPEAPPQAVQAAVEELTAEVYLRDICEQGLIERYGAERARTDEALRARLGYELDVITKMGFASYFLIVWDFIKYAKDHDIPVGPGRGSAVGSVVSYCLRITDLDPLKFNLFFERFLNPDRISMPDIDTDFCVERRDEVIDYVTEKYGKERVAQIVTFGTMAARAAVRDAGRALGIPLMDVDRIAKMIPSGPGGLTIAQALDQLPDLKLIYSTDPQIRKLLDTAKDIEGLARNAGTHAAGVVISAGPLIDYAPLVKFGDGGVNTQFDMVWVEKIGLLKMDFLGLRNLTVMNNAVTEIRRTVNADFDLAKIPDDDKRTFDMLSRGETMGVFQLESDGMKRVCQELKPSRFEDVIALVALYRPGPMDWIPQYINNKHGRTKPQYLHPKLEPILSETYGVACLRHDTPIWFADGSVRPISDVQPGDQLLTSADGQLVPAAVAKVWPSGIKPMLRIRLSTGTVIECSNDHRFPTPDGDVMAKEMRALLSADGEFDAAGATVLFESAQRPADGAVAVAAKLRQSHVLAITDAGDAECFDIEMSDQTSPYFVANGVLTHNCYQEQVMQMARDISGFTMGQADELRKVMGKKQKDKIPVYRDKFIKGAAETSAIDEDLAAKIFEFIEPFAGYGFNKSHAAAYAWISYQTAYLKANHALQYLTALMTSVKDKTDKLVEYIDEAKKMGITVLPPDVNESLVDFAAVGEHVRFGLAAIKGVGEGAVRSIIEARDKDGKFKDLFDLAKRVDTKQVNRRVFEALIKCGALDGIPGNRAQKLAALDAALDYGARHARDTEMGQFSLFGESTAAASDLVPTLPPVAAPSQREALAWEKETLGIFVSGHPLSDVQQLMIARGATPVKELRTVDDDAAVTVSGMVTAVRRTLTKNGQQILIATFEDTTGSCDVIVFSKLYPVVQHLFTDDAILTIKGRVRMRERPGAAGGEEAPVELSVSANEVSSFDMPLRPMGAHVNLPPVATAATGSANGNGHGNGHVIRAWHVTVESRDQIDRLAAVIDEWPGETPIVVHAGARSQKLPRRVAADPRLRGELERIFRVVREGEP